MTPVDPFRGDLLGRGLFQARLRMLEIDLQPRLVGGRNFFDLRPGWLDERLDGDELSLVD